MLEWSWSGTSGCTGGEPAFPRGVTLRDACGNCLNLKGVIAIKLVAAPRYQLYIYSLLLEKFVAQQEPSKRAFATSGPESARPRLTRFAALRVRAHRDAGHARRQVRIFGTGKASRGRCCRTSPDGSRSAGRLVASGASRHRAHTRNPRPDPIAGTGRATALHRRG